MSWYAAHLILAVRFKDGVQDRHPVWENVVLISAESDEEAFRKAEERGRADEGDDDGSFRWGDRPATWVFIGVRKLTALAHPDARPRDGDEVTYTEMEVDSSDDVDRLAAGDAVAAQLVGM